MHPPSYLTILLSFSLRATAQSSLAPTAPTAQTLNGTYSGVHSPEYNQDFFLGVPFAQPPLSSLRFTPPQPLNETFIASRPATAYAPECVGYGGDEIGYSQSEDCLYLNVIRPSNISADARLPVAVWIHGGGYSMGGTQDRRYNLSFIVDNSVKNGAPIMGVSVAYRLSAWGFLHSNQVVGAGATNVGLRDQRLALHWIQENIAAFGGDEKKVSIWGESAGGSSVGFHLVAYGGRDDGLFRGAAMESGNPVPYQSLNGSEFYQPIYDNITANVPDATVAGGNATCADAVDSLACLRAARYADLNAAFNTSRVADAWFPVVDGDFVTEYPSRLLARDAFVHVPIISGANSDEGTSFAPQGINTTQDFVDLVTHGQTFGASPGTTIPSSLVNQIVDAYPDDPCHDIPANAGCAVYGPPFGAQYRRAATYQGDVVFIANRRLTCQTWARNGVDAWCYRFNAVPFNQTTVTHFQEVAFVFDNTLGVGYESVGPPFTDKPPAYVDLAALMSRSWASFFATLDPNAWKTAAAAAAASSVPDGASGGAPPDWAKYSVVKPMNYVFDANVTSANEEDGFRGRGIRLINLASGAYLR